MAKTSTKKIAVSSKRLDADHLYYVDWDEGYYFHTYSQARKHAIKCLMELYLSRKKEKNTPYGVQYEIRINKAKRYASTIKMGFTPYAEWYAVISLEKKGNSFIITDYGDVPEKVTKLPLEKAVDYVRAKTL